MTCHRGCNRLIMTPACWPPIIIIYFGLFQGLSFTIFAIFNIHIKDIYGDDLGGLAPMLAGFIAAVGLIIAFAFIFAVIATFRLLAPDCYRSCVDQYKDVYEEFKATDTPSKDYQPIQNR